MALLYVVRHGDAVFSSIDEQRELSEFGRKQISLLAHSDFSLIDTVWVSPFIRAQQTFEILYKQSNLQADVVTQPLLQPEANLGLLQDSIYQQSSSHLLLVGHNPILSHLVNSLSAQADYWLNTGQLIKLRGDDYLPGCMQVIAS